ncbi:unnamed protein product [Ilex paraguariensis]|uniref:Rx N-terminal domain-containing protein n=1 Tax=Ilex paraguariensis TaxID=185542 RepID=A0ABC8UGP1_9AQUA
MAESVVSFVVERLGDLLINEAKFLPSVATTQVEQIQAELKRMQEIALDVQDVLETYAFRVSSRNDEGILRRCRGILKEPIVLHKIGSKIKAIETKISNLTKSLQTYGIKAMSEGESSNSANEKLLRLRRSYSHVVDEDFVGLEGDVEHLFGE